MHGSVLSVGKRSFEHFTRFHLFQWQRSYFICYFNHIRANTQIFFFFLSTIRLYLLRIQKGTYLSNTFQNHFLCVLTRWHPLMRCVMWNDDCVKNERTKQRIVKDGSGNKEEEEENKVHKAYNKANLQLIRLFFSTSMNLSKSTIANTCNSITPRWMLRFSVLSSNQSTGYLCVYFHYFANVSVS